MTQVGKEAHGARPSAASCHAWCRSTGPPQRPYRIGARGSPTSRRTYWPTSRVCSRCGMKAGKAMNSRTSATRRCLWRALRSSCPPGPGTPAERLGTGRRVRPSPRAGPGGPRARPPGSAWPPGRAPLVVRDDDELEVGLAGARVHDLPQRLRQALAVLVVQVGRRLVQREDAAVQAERLRQRQPDDQARQHLRPGPVCTDLGAWRRSNAACAGSLTG